MITAVIQARIGSSRLPKKVLLDLEGKTVLDRVIERVKAARKIENIVIATTVEKRDLEIAGFCAKNGYSVYCGSENDVLDRFYQAARLFNASHIVRVTSDCPMIDPSVIDNVIDLHLKNGSDYTSNVLKETYPDGQDVEIFTFGALKKAWESASMTSEREHVTPYIRNHSEIFKLSNLEFSEDLSSKRWTLDQAEDYEFIKRVYAALYRKNHLFGIRDILALIEKEPELEKHNIHIGRNEGYKKSLKEDKKIK